MSFVLDYQRHPDPSRRRILLSPQVVLPVVLAALHIHLSWQINRVMLIGLCGGDLRTAPRWCSAAWTPGAALMGRLGPGLGVVVLLAGSALAGWMLCQLLGCLAARTPRPGGAFGWRYAATLLLWAGWLPVPGDWSFVAQFREWAVFG